MEPLPVFRFGRVLAGLILIASLAAAQPTAPDSTAQTIVTVTAQAMPLEAAPASVTVLTREYIEGSHASNAADLLRSAPFLLVEQSGASGGMTTVSIRGGQSNFTLILLDGIPINDITTLLGGAVDLTSLPIENIERIEIVRGALSSVYGSDAIGGVIHFITRKGSKKSVMEGSGELGSFLRRQFRVNVSGTWKALQYSVGGSRLDVDDQVVDDGFSVSSAGASGRLTLRPNTFLDFTARWIEDQSAGFPTGSGGPEYALNRQPLSDDAKQLILGTSLKGQARPWWTYNLDLDWVHRTEDNVTPAIYDTLPPGPRTVPPATANTDFKRTRFNAGSRFALNQNLTLALNAGIRQEDGSTVGFLAVVLPQTFHLTRTSFLGSSMLEYSNHNLTATAGLSFDKTEGYGEVTSPRFGLNWLSMEHGPRFKTSWGKGFKLPSFYAFGNPIVGNKSLRPERAISFDAGIEQAIDPIHTTISGTYFRNDFRDGVDFDPVSFHLINRSKAIVQGVEFGTDWAAGTKFRFGLDFTYLTWEVEAGDPLRNVPHGNGGIHLDWKPSARFHARAETQWMGRRYDFETPVPNETSVGGYSNTNLAMDYDVTSLFGVYVRVDNLFDSHYHEFIGYPNPGASARAGVTFRSRAK